jgi:hypothetical protein
MDATKIFHVRGLDAGTLHHDESLHVSEPCSRPFRIKIFLNHIEGYHFFLLHTRFRVISKMSISDTLELLKSSIGANLQRPYDRVHVLLLTWAEHDIASLNNEIEELRDVFEREYNYTRVTVFEIPIDGSQEIVLNAEIAGFIHLTSATPDTLTIVFYAGHCTTNPRGKAEWSAFENGGPALPWHVAQQLLFAALGDVLLILDCCNGSLITPGIKNNGGRFELIAASAKGIDTPAGGNSFTRSLIRLLKRHAKEGISSQSLASKLREDYRIRGT